MSSGDVNRKAVRREVPVALIEASPAANALGHWILASPMLLFLAWTWTDIFAYYSPVQAYFFDAILAIGVFLLAIVLPLGYLAHRVVTALPRIFQHAGWDVQPLERVPPAEQHLVSYRCEQRLRAAFSLRRALVRVAQGWVYIEIAAIFAGAILMVPVFFSVTEFGFGR